MTTTLIPELDYKSLLRPHEKNPRRHAKADQEMVDSVKASGLISPLLVAPTGDEAVPYVLIDGHRRLDALKKARAKTAPALVREDLTAEGDQIQTMLLAALYREGLTPLEQAEGFEELRNLRGWTQKKISESTGVPVTTVRDRLKLLKLSKATQTRIHKGQLTLGDAMDLVAFDDDPETQARLVKAAGTYSWESQLRSAKRARASQAEADRVEANLVEAGTPRHDLPDGTNVLQRNYDDGPLDVALSFSEAPEDHVPCLAYVRFSDYWGHPVVKLVCTDPASHADQLDAAERALREERAAEIEARKQHERDHRVASDVRAAAVMKVAEEVVLPAPITDLLRSLLPALIYQLPRRSQLLYGVLVNDETLANGSEYYRVGWDAFAAHTSALSQLTPAAITRRLVAVLVVVSETLITPHGLRQEHSPLVERYYELLEQLDHHRVDVDDEILARHRGEDQAEESAS